MSQELRDWYRVAGPLRLEVPWFVEALRIASPRRALAIWIDVCVRSHSGKFTDADAELLPVVRRDLEARLGDILDLLVWPSGHRTLTRPRDDDPIIRERPL